MKRLLWMALLAGCASTYHPDPREEEHNAYIAQVRKQLEAGKMSNTDAMLAVREKRRAMGISDMYTEELDAYRIMLAGKLDRGEIRKEEAAYLETQKTNELIERLEVQIRASARPAGVPFDAAAFRAAQQRDAERQRAYQEMLRPGLEGAARPAPITCRPSIMGNIVCQ